MPFSDDNHIATLTVSQTLDFALATKAPGPKGRLPGVKRAAFINEVRDLLLRMLNISHTPRSPPSHAQHFTYQTNVCWQCIRPWSQRW